MAGKTFDQPPLNKGLCESGQEGLAGRNGKQALFSISGPRCAHAACLPHANADNTASALPMASGVPTVSQCPVMGIP